MLEKKNTPLYCRSDISVKLESLAGLRVPNCTATKNFSVVKKAFSPQNTVIKGNIDRTPSTANNVHYYCSCYKSREVLIFPEPRKHSWKVNLLHLYCETQCKCLLFSFDLPSTFYLLHPPNFDHISTSLPFGFDSFGAGLIGCLLMMFGFCHSLRLLSV